MLKFRPESERLEETALAISYVLMALQDLEAFYRDQVKKVAIQLGEISEDDEECPADPAVSS